MGTPRRVTSSSRGRRKWHWAASEKGQKMLHTKWAVCTKPGRFVRTSVFGRMQVGEKRWRRHKPLSEYCGPKGYNSVLCSEGCFGYIKEFQAKDGICLLGTAFWNHTWFFF